jgi:hypothetical protein
LFSGAHWIRGVHNDTVVGALFSILQAVHSNK